MAERVAGFSRCAHMSIGRFRPYIVFGAHVSNRTRATAFLWNKLLATVDNKSIDLSELGASHRLRKASSPVYVCRGLQFFKSHHSTREERPTIFFLFSSCFSLWPIDSTPARGQTTNCSFWPCFPLIRVILAALRLLNFFSSPFHFPVEADPVVISQGQNIYFLTRQVKQTKMSNTTLQYISLLLTIAARNFKTDLPLPHSLRSTIMLN